MILKVYFVQLHNIKQEAGGGLFPTALMKGLGMKQSSHFPPLSLEPDRPKGQLILRVAWEGSVGERLALLGEPNSLEGSLDGLSKPRSFTTHPNMPHTKQLLLPGSLAI